MALRDLRFELHQLRGSDWNCIPMLLSISTRGIGLNLCSFYAKHEALRYSNRNDLPDIYAVYRALLAIVEIKLYNVGLAPRNSEHVYKYEYRMSNFVGCYWIPVTIKRMIDAIGVVINGDEGVYFPVMSKNTEIDGKFVPRPENILLSNLRETVVALTDTNDSETAALYRKNFYLNNPLPASEWGQSHTLLNADKIMPAEYNYDTHLVLDFQALRSLQRFIRMPNDLHRISIDNPRGNISSLMSSVMSGLRTPDLRAGETLSDYYQHAVPEYDINMFRSPVKLNDKEVMMGATMLLGERPAIDNCPQIYASRSVAVNPYILRILLEESKLTIAQRQKSAFKLREKDEKKSDSELLVQMPLVRPRTSRRRSLSTIRESGIYEMDRYHPSKRGEDREKMKDRLANTMAYGDNEEQRPQPPPPISKKPQPKLPTSKQMWNELVTQIRERTEWLAEMEYLGQADPHRDIIKDQIAERMRALDALGIDDMSSTKSGKSARSTARARNKEENVSSYSQLSPLQYSPRRRQ